MTEGTSDNRRRAVLSINPHALTRRCRDLYLASEVSSYLPNNGILCAGRCQALLPSPLTSSNKHALHFEKLKESVWVHMLAI